jgi:hypothetical protein
VVSIVLRLAGFGRHSAAGWVPLALLIALAVLRRVGWLVLGGRGGRLQRDRQPPTA